MAKDKIEIEGLMVRTLGNRVLVEVEIDGKWHVVIQEKVDSIEGTFSNIIEPRGIRTAIERGFPFP